MAVRVELVGKRRESVGKAVDPGQRVSVVQGPVHTVRRADAGPQESSTIHRTPLWLLLRGFKESGSGADVLTALHSGRYNGSDRTEEGRAGHAAGSTCSDRAVGHVRRLSRARGKVAEPSTKLGLRTCTPRSELRYPDAVGATVVQSVVMWHIIEGTGGLQPDREQIEHGTNA